MNFIKKCAVAILFVTFLAPNALAGSLDDLIASRKGRKAYMSGDYKAAYKIWKSQADGGNARSAFLLARLFDMGDGIKKNQDKATEWYEKSAELGDLEAQWYLAGIYSKEGRYTLASHYYKLAANRGDELSQFSLGQLYSQGNGVIQDYVEAHMWFNLSASQNHKPAVKARDSIEKKMTRSQIAEAQKQAREFANKNRARR